MITVNQFPDGNEIIQIDYSLDGHQKAVEWLYRYLEDKETKDA